MADLTATQPMTDSAYEAMADQLLRDMQSLNEKIERDHAETQRIKIESRRIRDDYRRLGTPKRIESVWERTRPNGDVLRTVIKESCELSGDVLRIGGSGVLDAYPEGAFEEAAIITIFVRVAADVSGTAQPSPAMSVPS